MGLPKKSGVEHHTSDSDILWDKRIGQYKVAFICRGCNHESVAWQTVVTRPEWQGLCEDCRKRARFADIEMPGNVLIRRDPNDPQYGWVPCEIRGPGCKGERRLLIHSNLVLRCSPCAHYKRRVSKDELPRSGAIPLRTEPDPADPTNYTRRAFLCANPDQNPNCLIKDYGYVSYFRRPTWEGKCQACLAYSGGYRKIKTDRVLANGTTIGLTQEDERGYVPVTFFLCRHVIWWERDRAIQYSRRLGKICRACFVNPVALMERMAELKSQDDDSKQYDNNDEKKSPGRKATITEDKIIAALKVLGPYAPQEKLAEQLGVDPRSIRDWQKGHGLSYLQLRQQYAGTGGN